MSKLATVAIIGRPNTGKSTLFNRLIGYNKAITSEVAGTTRDHIAHTCTFDNYEYVLVDTGGMGGGTSDKELEDDVHMQSILALQNADVILVTLDSRTDLTRNDYEVLSELRKRKKQHVPVIYVLTKCDDPSQIESILPQFYSVVDADEVVAVSAPHKIGIDQLNKKIVTKIAELHFAPKQETQKNTAPRIAIIGRPNVGKSSIINSLMNDKKREASPLLVSDIAGTTRDSTDTSIVYNDNEYIFVDTAGIRRKKDTSVGIETHAYFRSIRSLEHCDIAILVLDAAEKITNQDKRIANLAVSEGKGLIILLNKWDKLDQDGKQRIQLEVEYELAFCKFAHIVPVSAHTREGLLTIFGAIEQVQRSRVRRLSTKQLLDFLQGALQTPSITSLTGCKHAVQADEVPPTFILFVRNPKQVQNAHLRYLENRMRELYDFTGVPLRFITKSKVKSE
jgi:GTPase